MLTIVLCCPRLEILYRFQIKLIRFSWNELMIAGYAFRSVGLHDGGILLSDGLVIKREGAHIAGVGEIFDRIHVELIEKMKEMRMVSSQKILFKDLFCSTSLPINSLDGFNQLLSFALSTLSQQCAVDKSLQHFSFLFNKFGNAEK